MFRTIVLNECQNSFVDIAKKNIPNLLETLSYYISLGRPCSLVNFFGTVISKMFLKHVIPLGLSEKCCLSDIKERVSSGDCIIPIFEARAREHITNNREICCFTPWEFGSRFFGNNGAHIPTWSFGRRFKKGKTINRGPQEPLGLLMAIWGSAFTASIKNLIEGTKGTEVYNRRFSSEAYSFNENIKRGYVPEKYGNLSVTTSEVHNCMYNFDTCGNFYRSNRLQLFDSGVDINLPILSLYRRTKNDSMKIKEGSSPDVIIIFDSSDDKIGAQLEKAKTEIISKGLPFPKLPSQSKIEKKIKKYGMCVFHENPDQRKYKDCDIPIVVYTALASYSILQDSTDLESFSFNINDFGTFKAKYPRELASSFMKMTERCITHTINKNQIKRAMIMARMRNLIRKMGRANAMNLSKFHELAEKATNLKINIQEMKVARSTKKATSKIIKEFFNIKNLEDANGDPNISSHRKQHNKYQIKEKNKTRNILRKKIAAKKNKIIKKKQTNDVGEKIKTLKNLIAEKKNETEQFGKHNSLKEKRSEIFCDVEAKLHTITKLYTNILT